MENDLPAESRDDRKIINVSIYGGNYNENIHGDYQQNSPDYQAAILQRTLNLRSPYKGLKRFNARDKDLFFGRQRLIDELIEAVNQSNLVLVLGASGSGKSSVVRAGVMPQIESSPDQSCLFTPYRNPFESFYRSLLNPEKNYGIDEADLEFIREGNHDSLKKAIALLQTKQSEWLIFIDQFEELFTLCPNRETRGNFIQGLINLSQDSNHSVKFILAMRSDFLQELATYPQFSRIASPNIHLVADLEEGELRQAIEQPAAQHGVVLEAGLVEEIIRDVQGQAGSLPLLQYTLNLLWQNEDLSDRTLNIATYHQLGGVTGALQKHVNEIYQELSAQEQLATKQILLRLVDVVALEQSEVQRTAVGKRAYKSEFTDTQTETVQFLINKSLLISDDLNQEGSTVEIAHEALLNSWAELKAWINDARTTISLNNRLAEDASRWQELKHQDSSPADDELWSGSKLEQVIELSKDGTFAVVLGGLSQLADEFINQSIEKRDRKIQQELETAQRLAQADRKARIEAEKRVIEQKKANQKLRIWSLVAVAFGVTATWLGISSYINSQESQLQAQAANIKVKLALSNQLDRLLESIELVGQNQTFNQRWFKPKSQLLPDVQSVLYQAVEESREKYSLNDHQAKVYSVAVSSDGQYLVSGSDDNMVKLWNAKSKSLIHTFKGHQAKVNSVAISNDGQYLVSGSDDNTVKLWDIKKQSLIHTFEGHQAEVTSVAISSDGRRLVSGSRDNTVKLWGINQQSLIHSFEGHQDSVNAVAISNDGQYLVSASFDTTVKLWDIKKQSLIYSFEGHQDSVNAVAISNDGQYLVSGDGNIIYGSQDYTMKLWNIKSQSLIHTFEGHQDLVTSVAISNDGQYLVSASFDHTVKLWDVKSQSLIHTFEGHQSWVNSVAISNDGQYLVSASFDHTVKLWEVKNQSVIHTFEGHQEAVNSVVISSDGRYFVSGSDDNMVKLWDVKSKSVIHIFEGHQAHINSVAISSDGNYLVSGSHDQTVKLWDVNKQLLIHTFEGHQKAVNSVAISSDGRYLVSGSGSLFNSDDNTVKLWDVNKQSLIHTFEGHQELVTSVAISSDGRYLVSGSSDNTVKLWDIKNQSLIHTFEGHQSWINSVAISSDGQYLVSGSQDNTVKLWDIKKQFLIHTFESHQAAVHSVAISNDGQYLVSGSSDRTIKLWDVKTQSLIHTFEGHQAAVHSVAISNDGRYLVSGSRDNTVKLWAGTAWQSWLSIGCQRIRTHPVLVSMEREAAAATCLEYGDFTEQEQAELLVKQGLAFAREKADYKEAKDKFKQAQKLKPDIDLNPKTEVIENNPKTVASQLTAPSKVEQGVNLAKESKVQEALSSFSEAQKLYPKLKIEAQSWHNLCRFGSIHSQAQEVLFACENAVKSAPDDESKAVYLDSRGLAKALTGNTQGAVKDFQTYVNSPESNQESRNRRKQWIESLSTGQNPFTDDVLEELKNEKQLNI